MKAKKNEYQMKNRKGMGYEKRARNAFGTRILNQLRQSHGDGLESKYKGKKQGCRSNRWLAFIPNRQLYLH